MKAKRITVITVIVMLVIILGTVPAAARATRISYTGTECPIEWDMTPDKEWISNGILHQRGLHNINITQSTTDYTSGITYIDMNMEIDLATGAVHAYGSIEIHPDAYDGTWVGSFSTHVSAEGILNGYGVGHGTGDLEGLVLFNHMSNPDFPRQECSYRNNNDTGEILFP